MSVCPAVCVSSCASAHIWLGVSSAAATQRGGLWVLTVNSSGLCRGRDVPAGAHSTQSSASPPTDEIGASPHQASTSPVKERVWQPKTHPCLPCRRPENSPAPASLTLPPPTPLNLALPSPAVRARLAAKTSAALESSHLPWRALESQEVPCSCSPWTAMSHTCGHLSQSLGQAGRAGRPMVRPGNLGQSSK